MMRRWWALVAAVVGVAILGVGFALSGGGSSDQASEAAMGEDLRSSMGGDSSSEDGAGGDSAASEAAPDEGSDAGSEGGGVSGRVPADSLQPRVISTGSISVAARDVGKARQRLGALVTGWRGYIADESTESDSEGRVRSSSVTVRVPADRFDEAVDRIGGLGRLLHADRQAEDVTTQVLDVDARLRAQEKSLLRMEALLARAEAIGEVVTVEAEVARRQADLEALQSQQAWLADQTSYATLQVSLERRGEPVVTEKQENPFLAGLGSGWATLVGAGSGIAVVAGAVLPFLPLLLLVVLGGRWAVRRAMPGGIRGRRPSAV